MTTADTAWREELAELVRRAPDELRALASDELHIGGFTNVRLEHPVLDLRDVADEALAARALAFFAAASVLRDAAVARVHVRREHASVLPRRAKSELRGLLARIDDENASLLRYFDLYLQPAASLSSEAGRRLVKLVAGAFDAAS